MLLTKVREARIDFETFFELVWHDPQGRGVKIQPHQRIWLKAIKENPRVMILAARSHGKTDLLIALGLFELSKNPNLRIKWICQSDRKAREILSAVKGHIERNPVFRLVFPEIRPAETGEWSKGKIVVERTITAKDPTVDALGVMSTVVGGRSDLLIVDDVVDYKSAIIQPQSREAIKAKFFSELLPTLEPGGRIWIAATPWAKTDLYAKIRGTPGWVTVETPVGTDQDPFLPLWEARWNREKLKELRAAWGPIDYDRAFRLKILSDDVVPVRPHWIQYYDRQMLGDPADYFCLISFDLAISQAASADFFACTVVLHDLKRNKFFVADAWHAHLTFLEQVKAVINTARTWGADRVVIEQTNYEGALAQSLHAEAGYALPVQTVRPRGNKQRRLLEITPLLEAGQVFFHPGMDPHKNPGVVPKGDLITELIGFPYEKNDDLSDSLVQALQALRELGGRSEDGTKDYEDGDVSVRVYSA